MPLVASFLSDNLDLPLFNSLLLMNTLHATSTPPTRKLTAEELALYEKQGYLEVTNVITREELVELNREIDLIRENPDPHQDSNRIFRLGLRSQMADDFCKDERLLTLVEDIVYPGIAIYAVKMVEKQPHDSTVCHWHQDNAYFDRHSTSESRMSVWIPLQDCDENNGCLWVVPGSHKKPLLPHEVQDNGICRLSFSAGTEDMPGAIPCKVSAGSVILFHGQTWHRSLGNKTSNHRRSFIITYQDAVATKGNKQQHKILRKA